MQNIAFEGKVGSKYFTFNLMVKHLRFFEFNDSKIAGYIITFIDIDVQLEPEPLNCLFH